MQINSRFLSSFFFCVFASLSVSLCAAPAAVHAREQESLSAVLRTLERQRLAVLPYEPMMLPKDVSMDEQVAFRLAQQRNPQEYLKQQMVYRVLEAFYDKHKVMVPKIIDDTSVWNDLTLNIGKGKGAPCVVDAITHAFTCVGRKFGEALVLTPTNHVPTICNRQEIIKQLCALEREGKRIALDQALTTIGEHELTLISCLQDDDFFVAELTDHYSTIGVEDADASLNRNIGAVEAINATQHMNRGLAVVAGYTAPFVMGAHALCYMADVHPPEMVTKLSRLATIGGALAIIKAGATSMTQTVLNIGPVGQKRMEMMGVVGDGWRNWLSAKRYLDYFQCHWALDKYAYKKMRDIARCFDAIEDLAQQLRKNPDLKNRLQLAPSLINLFDDADSGGVLSDDWKQLRALLAEDTFAGSESSWLYSRGRVLVAYKLMSAVKNELTCALAAIAEIDAYCSVARLMSEHEQERVGYCYVSFTDSSMPYLELHDFWHPLVPLQSVVVNSLTLGAHGIRNCVVTGPNEGGKSTILKSVAISIVLAQSFGIAPARKMVLTPFSLIATHVHMKDDIGGGNSLFKAEAMRAHSLLEKASALRPGELSFMAIDEIFRSTAPQEASAAAYSVLKQLGQCVKGITLLATHFQLPTRLAMDTAHFANYQVPIHRNHDRTVCRPYPYKLIPGVYTDCVAIEVLRAQGFESAVMSDAYAVLETIKNQQAP